jgi:uracil-DNA glycosylase
MFDEFVKLIPDCLLYKSGAVFYSGRNAFSKPSSLYILGLNPGGSPTEQANDTVKKHTEMVLNKPEYWSEYQDEIWRGNSAGTSGMQPRILYLLHQVNLDPQKVPASNVIFERSAREKDIKSRFSELVKLCWPFHKAVIEQLGVRVVLCFGKSSGYWVREMLQANTFVEEFVEKNCRHWKSATYKNSSGIAVVVATHPSIADWTNSATDPSQLVKHMLDIQT